MSERARLPNRRACESFSFEVSGQHFTASVGHFPNGAVAEVFLSNGKCGSDADTNARDAAVVASIAFQHGVALDTIRRALARDSQGRASGALGVALDLIAEAAP